MLVNSGKHGCVAMRSILLVEAPRGFIKALQFSGIWVQNVFSQNLGRPSENNNNKNKTRKLALGFGGKKKSTWDAQLT